ncbi:hypothetical protein [Arthrobacter sp. SLBN-122]|uniref:hypothetical protein n=1 Tax=Arthrobacter sp. SLBN-122 TaxID=2768455 RepID=UPI001154EAFB|nr:hypothetical protein [Arthrobacter sp. SLBN-122]TQJ36782.1 hypothetical protein FBY36_4091 [Arthrobacter sp. SLBN-122]
MAVVDDRRGTWRLASSLLLAGVVVSILAGLLHAESHDANDHLESFTAYANSGIWTPVHLGQFVGMALVGAGLVSLATGLASRGTAPGVQLRPLGWTARFGAVSAAAAVALHAALQAVDGVALKQAVDAWAAAPDPEKAARFATAEGIRWLEWGMRSYQSILLGAALVLVGVAVAATHHVPRMIGYLMALSGLGYLAQGWIIGESGFSAGNALPTLVSILAIVISAIWLAISTWRMKEQTPRPSGSPESIAP